MSKRALIVIDVQGEYFLPTGRFPIAYPPIEESLARIGTAMDTATAAGIPVVVVQHSSPEGVPVFAPDTPQWSLHPVVADRSHDHRLEKRTASAFFGTDLAEWLTVHRIDTITVAGYMTHNCDLATAFDGAAHGFTVELLSDATGTLPIGNAQGDLTARQVHESLLVILASNVAAVTTTEEWVHAATSATPLEAPDIIASTARARETRV